MFCSMNLWISVLRDTSINFLSSNLLFNYSFLFCIIRYCKELLLTLYNFIMYIFENFSTMSFMFSAILSLFLNLFCLLSKLIPILFVYLLYVYLLVLCIVLFYLLLWCLL